MATLPVNAIYAGLQPDGHFTGTPALVIQIMDHPRAATTAPQEGLDGSYPLPEWDLDTANEVSFDKLLIRRGSSPHFANVGAATLAALAVSYRERHVLIVGRELGHHDIALLARLLLEAGRSVQIETTAMAPSLLIANTWATLLALPSRQVPTSAAEAGTGLPCRPNEVLASIRWRGDLDRAETSFANRKLPVWLRPSMYAEDGIYRQCLAVATRHPGWRVMRPVRTT